ncbi:hypothetical protein LY10_02562 [Planktotalea frisia]|jgi:hypothetical protein|uniref:Uncharacterized protein n=1 Tax=Planktotalea frisia TaxID=696762 RepID=A0A1L9NUZ6_9RHOB|nr:hypothetical protein PFRI_26360 [Planktotalea frisia]PZX26626.1 hypothetical protein LY10_02562 [Planktotalea frisia]
MAFVPILNAQWKQCVSELFPEWLQWVQGGLVLRFRRFLVRIDVNVAGQRHLAFE